MEGDRLVGLYAIGWLVQNYMDGHLMGADKPLVIFQSGGVKQTA